MRKYLTALSVAGLVVCVMALSMNRAGLASERGSGEEPNAESADIEAQRRLAVEQEEAWPEGFSSDAGIRTAMGGPESVDISVSKIGRNGNNDYREYGIVGDIAAFSSGTTACNVGHATAEWISGSSGRHPVIAQNMYRMSADGERFEMIGMSWLKHSFCALSEPSCGSCQGTGCSSLGVGCADTYTANRNGTTNIGPRRDVNPMGLQFEGNGPGTHDHPYSSPSGNGTIAGRLQVKVNDLSHAGAEYYIEVHYVTHDEGLTNRYNNASWMSVNMPPSPYTGNITNNLPLNEQEVALIAWQEEWEDTETPVMIRELQDTDRGLFQLGSRVSYNGDGTWHYEYALHNMNSHLAGSSFTIPIPEGVTLTNLGFHDVFYHSGDGYPGFGTFDGTDWAPEDSGTDGSRALAWSTVTFDDNPNGNALRWGTTYNFRFDADTPPQDATATIVHYRGSTDGPGTPASISGLTQGPSPLASDCVGDVDGNGVVDASDLAILLGSWGPNPGHPADFDGDGNVDEADLAVLLGAWGPCP